MDLHEALSIERYRHALERQRLQQGNARRALVTYAILAAADGGAVATLLAARESLGLDKAIMPAMLALLAWVLVFLAAITILQIVVAMARWRRSCGAAAAIDALAPRPARLWWLGDGVAIVLVAASAAAGWILLAGLAGIIAGE